MTNGVDNTKSGAYCSFLNVSSQDYKKLSDPGPDISEGQVPGYCCNVIRA